VSAATQALGWPIAQVATALHEGAFSSEALTEAALDRARDRQPTLNAFIALRADEALAQARACDLERARGQWRGPLHGIPLAHKDCFERESAPMTVGSRVLDAQPGRRTATVLGRLAAAGAVDLGPLQLNEMVAGPTGQNPHFGDCGNSADPSRISGGSSSGSGTAVGGGLVFGSLGSDTGGSIRLPGSMNGLFALKPTYGRVSRAGCFPRAFSLDCVGPLARTAEDCALLLQAVAGADPADPSAAAIGVPDYARLLATQAAGTRVAALDMAVPLDPQVERAYANLVAAASARYGARAARPFELAGACNAMADIISKVEAATLHGGWMRERPQRYSQAVYSRTEPGLHVPAVRYLEAINARAAILREFLAGPLADADVLLCPTVPIPVPTREEADMEAGGKVFGVVARLTALTRPFSYLGLPVLSMPMGRDANGMPMGVQLVGRPFGEARLLALAQTLAADIAWHGPFQGEAA